jgi:hypothetical protein
MAREQAGSCEESSPQPVSIPASANHSQHAGGAGKEFDMTTNTRIALTPVESSQIHSIGHDAATNTLAIRFKNYEGDARSLYHYDNFTTADFAAFQGAESIGRHFGQHIKNATEKYPFRKVDESQLDAGKRVFRFAAGMDISVTVEVDLNVLTPAVATEINNFWSSAEEVLDVSDGDVVVAAARRAAAVYVSELVIGRPTFVAERELAREEGWPPEDQIGIRIVDFDVPDYSPSELEFEELAA